MPAPRIKPSAADLYSGQFGSMARSGELDIGATAHTAASLEVRGLEQWAPVPASADADMLEELPRIAARGRDLERNNPLAFGATQTFRDNIVGHVLRLSAKPDHRALGWDIEQARRWSDIVESEFHDYADSEVCDVENEETLLGQSLRMLTGAMVSGNAIGVPKWIEGDRWRTKFLVVEGDRLETPPEFLSDPNVRAGRRLNKDGRVMGYYIRKRHPGDQFWWYAAPAAVEGYDYIPATTPWGRKQVIHLADRTRAGQSLGRSIFTPAMKEFHQAGKYTNAELSRALVQSLVGAFIESSLDSAEVARLLHGQRSTVDIAGAEKAWRSTLGEYRPRLKEGSLIPLPIGARAKGFENGAPSGNFDQFTSAVVRWISAALGIPYELLAKDFTKTSYSSARAALLEAWRFFQGRRVWLIRRWLQPVYGLWMEEAISAGRIPDVTLSEFYARPHAYLRARWVFAGRGWVDPVKEAQAAQLRMEIGMSTLEAECAEQGLDWEEVLEQRAHEQQRLQELGLSLGISATTATATQQRPAEDEEREENAPPGQQQQQEAA